MRRRWCGWGGEVENAEGGVGPVDLGKVAEAVEGGPGAVVVALGVAVEVGVADEDGGAVGAVDVSRREKRLMDQEAGCRYRRQAVG